MFEDMTSALGKLERGIEVKVPIEPDKEGYLDKECPSKDCESLFKVQQDDWETLVHDDVVYCPVCRHEAPADEWFTTYQVEQAKKIATIRLEGTSNNTLLTED